MHSWRKEQSHLTECILPLGYLFPWLTLCNLLWHKIVLCYFGVECRSGNWNWLMLVVSRLVTLGEKGGAILCHFRKSKKCALKPSTSSNSTVVITAMLILLLFLSILEFSWGQKNRPQHIQHKSLKHWGIRVNLVVKKSLINFHLCYFLLCQQFIHLCYLSISEMLFMLFTLLFVITVYMAVWPNYYLY